MNKKRFTIGDWVLIRATVGPLRVRMMRTIKRQELKARLHCQVVGISRLYEGRVHNDEDYGAYFEPGKLHQVWLVRAGMENSPLRVLDEDIEKPGASFGDRTPIRDPRGCHRWAEKDKDELREIMKKQPRDSRGRWMKN